MSDNRQKLHDNNIFPIKQILPRNIILRVHASQSVKETKRANNGGSVEHLSVEAEPAEVETDLVAEVSTDQPEGLFLVQLARARPLEIQELKSLNCFLKLERKKKRQKHFRMTQVLHIQKFLRFHGQMSKAQSLDFFV